MPLEVFFGRKQTRHEVGVSLTCSQFEALLKNLNLEFDLFEYRLEVDDSPEPMHVFCSRLTASQRRICIICDEQPDQSGELSIEILFGTYIDGSPVVVLENTIFEYLNVEDAERAIRRYFTSGSDKPRKVRRIEITQTLTIPIIRS